VARRGASQLAPRDDDRGRAARAWDDAGPRRDDARDRDGTRHEQDRPWEHTDLEPPEPEEWILEGIEQEAQGAVRRGGTVRGSRTEPKAPVRAKRAKASKSDAGTKDDPAPQAGFDKAVGATRGARLEGRLKEASRSFKRERYGEARKILRPLAREAPGVSEVRELLGLTYYREGQWKEAVRELEAFRELTGSVEQNPVLADCYRAMGRFGQVETLWDELRSASPGADLVAEGRIVAAGALADQGRLADAIRLLESGRKKVAKPHERHLRMAYALADLYERAGDVPGARSQFGWLRSQDPDFADVEDRLANLR
jgi:tetratricopeptide (TPR) repeat protein